MKKPVIGITCDFSMVPPAKKGMKPRGRFAVGRSYVKAVIEAGGIPMLLAGAANPKDVEQQIELLDGIILTGSADHDPKLYGEKKHPKTKLMHDVRQQYEIQVGKMGMKSNKPILGICGGCQALNIVNGGSLIQDIPIIIGTPIIHSQKQGRSVLTHDVYIDRNSRLFQIIKKDKIKSNSFHHQAVKKVANGFKVAACTKDDIVESIEIQNKRFVLGVQWHPEELTAHKEHLALFKALIEAAKSK